MNAYERSHFQNDIKKQQQNEIEFIMKRNKMYFLKKRTRHATEYG